MCVRAEGAVLTGGARVCCIHMDGTVCLFTADNGLIVPVALLQWRIPKMLKGDWQADDSVSALSSFVANAHVLKGGFLNKNI